MANGDAAAAAGMDVVAGTADLRLAYDEENKGRDYLAAHMSAGTAHTQAQISGLPATLTAINAAIAGKQDTLGSPVVWRYGATDVYLTTDGSNLLYNVGAGGVQVRNISDGQFGSNPIYSPHGRANGVSGGLTAYLGADGRLAVGASSRRFKKEIASWAPDVQAVLAMQVVKFRYRASFDGHGNGPAEVGLIAEDLHELGLTWLVFYDEDGTTPRGVHYDKIALALLGVVQDHEARLVALEQKVRG